MIVPMKKVSLVVLDSHREESLEELRGVGVLHLQSVEAASEALTDLQDDRAMLEHAMRLLPEPEEPVKVEEVDLDKAFQTAAKVLSLSEMTQGLSEDIGRLEYCLDVASKLGLTRQDIFAPRPAGMKPIQRQS